MRVIVSTSSLWNRRYLAAKKDAADEKKKDAENTRAAADAKKAEAMNKRLEADAKRAEIAEMRAKAQQARDRMVGNLTDGKAKRKASFLADAAFAGKPIQKVEVNFIAANESQACDNAYAAMKLNSSIGVCEVIKATSSRRRRILADTAYLVALLLSEAEIDNSTLSAALVELADANISATTNIEDALALLATVDGIDDTTLATITNEAMVCSVCDLLRPCYHHPIIEPRWRA